MTSIPFLVPRILAALLVCLLLVACGGNGAEGEASTAIGGDEYIFVRHSESGWISLIVPREEGVASWCGRHLTADETFEWREATLDSSLRASFTALVDDTERWPTYEANNYSTPPPLVAGGPVGGNPFWTFPLDPEWTLSEETLELIAQFEATHAWCWEHGIHTRTIGSGCSAAGNIHVLMPALLVLAGLVLVAIRRRREH